MVDIVLLKLYDIEANTSLEKAGAAPVILFVLLSAEQQVLTTASELF